MADDKSPEEERKRRERYDRPDADTSGQYGSLDQDLGYGGGRDPGNLGHYGREATTHNYGGDENREELGWEGGSRPTEGAPRAREAADGDPADADRASRPDERRPEGGKGSDPRR